MDYNEGWGKSLIAKIFFYKFQFNNEKNKKIKKQGWKVIIDFSMQVRGTDRYKSKFGQAVDYNGG